MKIIEVRNKIHRFYLFFGMFWLVPALYGLYSDKAIVITMPHFHIYKVELVPLLKDPRTYWSNIKFQLVYAAPFIVISFVRLPFLDPFFEKIHAEQAGGNRPFAWVATWLKENKTAMFATKTIGLIVWLMMILGTLFLVFKFANK